MICAFDTTFLTLALNPDARGPVDPNTGNPVTHCRQRVEGLIDRLSNAGDQVIVPAPCLAEAMVIAEDFEKLLVELGAYQAIEVRPFGAIAAVELAQITRAAMASGDKRGGGEGSYQKVKLDRQIVAIAVAEGASILFTDDGNQTTFAGQAGLRVSHTWELSLPDKYAQMSMLEDQDGDGG